MKPRQFASDTHSGICPEAWRALEASNRGHAESYGNDAWTRRAEELFRELFETDCAVHFVFGGTAANGLALAAMGRPYERVLCHELAHIVTGECGAAGFFSGGMTLTPLAGPEGKLRPEDFRSALGPADDVHAPRASIVSITQATEAGSVYSISELERIGATARELGLRLHMDGARFANALVALGARPAELSWKAGVQALSFGASKNGGPLGDALVFFDLALAEHFAYRQRQAGQLCSKVRFVAAPLIGMLESGAWLSHAAHANAMARKLELELSSLPELKILFPVQVNAVYVTLGERVRSALRERGWLIYTHIGDDGCRLVCSWDTTAADIDAFVGDVKSSLGA